jgi:hypothetical protein
VLARSRITFACIAVVLAVACIFATWRAPSTPGHVDGFADLFVFAMVVSMLFVFGAFNHTHLDRRSGQTGFPNRLFTYPVTTRLLVGVPMLCGVATTIAVYLAWTTLVIRPLGREFPLTWPALVLAAAMAWYQATLWSLAAFRVVRMIALCLIGTTLITISLIPAGDFSGNAQAANLCLFGTMAALALTAYAFALFAVKRQRHAGGHGAGLRFVQEKLLDRLPARRRPFRSSMHAQFWIESHRGSLFLPAGTLLVMLFVMFIAALMRHVPADTTAITLTTIFAAPIVLAVLSGAVTGMPLVTSADSAMAPFLSTRPITCGDMVLAKLASAAVATTLAWAVVLVLTPIWLMTWCDTTPLERLWSHFTIMFPGRQRWLMLVLCAMTVWLITWRMSIVNIPVALQGRAAFLTAYVMAGIAVTVTVVALICNDLDTAAREGAGAMLFNAPITLACLLNGLLLAKLAIAGSSTGKGLLRGWVRSSLVGASACVWIAASAIVALTLYLLASHEPTLSRAVPWLGLIAALWGLLLVPLARVALAAQALARVRHG